MSGLDVAVLSGFAKKLAPRKISNDDLKQWMDTSDEWIRKRSGIEARYWVDENTTTASMAIDAAKLTLDSLGNPRVDAIIVATITPDFNMPGIGVQIQHGLGLEAVPAYDLRNQCSGFLYGIEMASALIAAKQYERILLIGSEVHSTGLDISTEGRDVSVLFGDGAGSCVVEHIDNRASSNLGLKVLGSELHSDGEFIEKLWCKYPGSSHFPTRITPEVVESKDIFPEMEGRFVFENAVKRMCEVSASLLGKHGMSPGDIKLLVAHQANLRINKMVAHQLGLSEEQNFSTIQKYGNTTAATIPIGFTDAFEAGAFSEGDIVLSAAFGSGFTWGATLFQAVSS